MSRDGADPDAADQERMSLQVRVSNAVVQTMKDLYGRGPTGAKTFFCDEYIFCVMSGGLTRDEETMLRAGEHDAVREHRLRFQAVIAPELIQIPRKQTVVAAREPIRERQPSVAAGIRIGRLRARGQRGNASLRAASGRISAPVLGW